MRHLPIPNHSLCCLLLAASVTAQEGQSSYGHARARELAELGRLPGARDVVVRDLVNYHRHRLPLPRADQDVALDLRFDRSAADGEDAMLQVGYTTRPMGDRSTAPPVAVSLVVDCSGSMADRDKITAVRAGLREFVRHLRPTDEVALVAFSSDARVVAGRARVGDGRRLQDAIEQLEPDRSTNLHAGLMLGLRELGTDAPPGASRRVVLLTDGIANTGVTDPAAILEAIAPFTRQGVDVTTVGVGEHLDTALLQRLAGGTRGLFHFVADPQDVQKVFAAEVNSLLLPAARSVRLRLELGPTGRIVEAFHEGACVQSGQRELDLDLPDLNAGATGVVMLRVRARPGARGPIEADAILTFRSATTGRSGRESARAELGLEAAARPQFDVEVQRNAAIAVLAQGLADMAKACDERRWAAADRALRLARDEAQRLFPGEDQDLQRVREIAAGHLRTLQRYVDRFRDY